MTSMEKLASLLCMLFVLQDCHGWSFVNLRQQRNQPAMCTDMSHLFQCLAPLKRYKDHSDDVLSFFELVDESSRDQFCRDAQEALGCARTNLLDPSCNDYFQTIIRGLISVEEFVCSSRGRQMLQDMAGTPCTKPSVREDVSGTLFFCKMLLLESGNLELEGVGQDPAFCSGMTSFRECVLGVVESECGRPSGLFAAELYELVIETASEVYPRLNSC